MQVYENPCLLCRMFPAVKVRLVRKLVQPGLLGSGTGSLFKNVREK